MPPNARALTGELTADSHEKFGGEADGAQVGAVIPIDREVEKTLMELSYEIRDASLPPSYTSTVRAYRLRSHKK